MKESEKLSRWSWSSFLLTMIQLFLFPSLGNPVKHPIVVCFSLIFLSFDFSTSMSSAISVILLGFAIMIEVNILVLLKNKLKYILFYQKSKDDISIMMAFIIIFLVIFALNFVPQHEKPSFFDLRDALSGLGYAFAQIYLIAAGFQSLFMILKLIIKRIRKSQIQVTDIDTLTRNYR